MVAACVMKEILLSVIVRNVVRSNTKLWAPLPVASVVHSTLNEQRHKSALLDLGITLKKVRTQRIEAFFKKKKDSSPGRARTCDLTVNSRALYLLSYGGLVKFSSHVINLRRIDKIYYVLSILYRRSSLLLHW